MLSSELLLTGAFRVVKGRFRALHGFVMSHEAFGRAYILDSTRNVCRESF